MWTVTANRSNRNPRDKSYANQTVARSGAGNKCFGIFWQSQIVTGTRSQSWNCDHWRFKLSITSLTRPTNALECNNLIMLHSNKPHVSSTHVDIFRVVKNRNNIEIDVSVLNHRSKNSDTLIIIAFLFSSPCRWSAETCRWLPFNKITSTHWSVFVGLFKNLIYIETARSRFKPGNRLSWDVTVLFKTQINFLRFAPVSLDFFYSLC
jgi:hypothetical protein